MAYGVYIAGAARTDFKRNLSKEGKDLRSLIVEAGTAAILDGGLTPGDVESGVVGNFAAGMFTRQLHLGAMLVGIGEAGGGRGGGSGGGMRGIPTVHVEAACASGGVAVLTGAQQIMAGVADVVLVVGAEQQKTMAVSEGGEVLGAAGDYRAERERYGAPLFPKLFGEIARRYSERYGDISRGLGAIAAKNLAQAKLNPEAQTRERGEMTVEGAMTTSEGNPMIAAPLRLADCSQVTDGAAAVVLVSEGFAKRKGLVRGLKLEGFGHTTDVLGLDGKEVPEFGVARRAADRAYGMAGVGPGELSVVEVHDCFSITELVAYELLSLAERGKGGELAASGGTALAAVRGMISGGRALRSGGVPVNPGGGLIGDGHPVGATGVRQVVDAYRQLMGRAGAMQVEGAKRAMTFNMGGTLTTSVAMIWGRA